MTPPPVSAVRSAIERAFKAAVEAVDPVRLTAGAVSAHGPWDGEVTVLALGKAAPGMARGALAALPRRPVRTVVVAGRPVDLEDAELHVGGHPFPDVGSVAAGNALLDAARACRDTLLVLVSGGGSALAEVPRSGLSLDELVEAQRAVMLAGAPIEDLNLVRRRLSVLKDGGLAAASPARRIVTLLVSDVVDAGPEDVASGPTLPDRRKGAEALAVVERLGLRERMPPAVIDVLATPRPTPVGRPHDVAVLADGGMAAAAAARALEADGIPAAVRPERLRGEARDEAGRIVSSATGDRAMVAWGETTVTVTGSGSGGRNQEGALAAALALRGTDGVFGSFGTDGIDGPTDAAGAIVDGGTAVRIEAAGLDPAARLADNDAHPALDAAGDLVRTGRTGTNVADVWVMGPLRSP